MCIADDGQIYTWGSNTEGQLGLNDCESRLQPTRIERCHKPSVTRLQYTSKKRWIDVSAGYQHSLAITSKNKVYAWGKNDTGQLGLIHRKNRSVPTSILQFADPLNPLNVCCLAAGEAHSAAVVESGDVYQWGRMFERDVDPWIEEGDRYEVDEKTRHKREGEMYYSEYVVVTEPRLVPGMKDKSSVAVACGSEHTVALTKDGQVWSWGVNRAGQLGLGHLRGMETPQHVLALDEHVVIQVACGASHTMVLTSGSGSTPTPQAFGFGDRWSSTPELLRGLTQGTSPVEQVESGGRAVAVVRRDGSVQVQGSLDGTADFPLPSALDGMKLVRDLALGSEHGMLLREELVSEQFLEQRKEQEQRAGEAEGQEDAGAVAAIAIDDLLEEEREYLKPRVPAGMEASADDGPDPDAGIEDLADDDPFDPLCCSDPDAGIEDSADDDPFDWADDDPLEVPEPPSAPPWYLISLGSSQYIRPEAWPGSAPVRQLACGEGHVLANCVDGTVWSWGRNECGQLGHGDTEELKYMRPTQVMDLAANCCISIGAGGKHSTALTTKHKVFAWGSNECGQLGLGIRDELRAYPDSVRGLELPVRTWCADNFTVALSMTEQVYVWGGNEHGQLGLGHTSSINAPRALSFFESVQVSQLVCGSHHCLALVAFQPPGFERTFKTIERVYAWGRGDEGQLGLGDTVSRMVPTHVTTLSQQPFPADEPWKRPTAVSVDAGGCSSAAIVLDSNSSKQVYTWGSVTGRSLPAPMDLEADNVHIGPGYMIAIKALERERMLQRDGGPCEVYSWGGNFAGQLGPEADISTVIVPEKILSLSSGLQDICCGRDHMLVTGPGEQSSTWFLRKQEYSVYL